MIHRSIHASVVLNALVFTLGCGIALGQIADPKCADKANKFAAKVSATQNKENRSCVKNQGKGKLQTTVEACLTADAKQKVQKKKNKVSSLFAAGGACEGNEATDLVTDATTINGAHVNASIDLIHDIFGADLDAGQISQDKNDAKCQDKLAQRTGQVFDTWLKEFRKCKKAAMKDGATTAAEVITACLSAAPVRGFGSGLPDPKGKIEKKSSKLADDVAGKCQGLDLDALAPGACVGGGVQGDVGKCLDDLAECEACQAIKQADGLDIDCDLIDNDIIGTCPPTPVPAAECEILNAAECLLPYPSSHFLVADGGTATGLRVDLPASGMPSVNGPAYSPRRTTSSTASAPWCRRSCTFRRESISSSPTRRGCWSPAAAASRRDRRGSTPGRTTRVRSTPTARASSSAPTPASTSCTGSRSTAAPRARRSPAARPSSCAPARAWCPANATSSASAI